jgi:hypothetical protein
MADGDGLRLRTVAVLVAGRGGYRIAQYLTGLSLLAIWGPVEFAAYAAATGAAGWLLALASTGIERAALIYVSREGRRLEPLFVALAMVPFGVAGLTWGVLELSGPGRAVTYAAAATLLAGTGAVAVPVGLFRLRGVAYADPAAFVAVSMSYLGGLGLVAGFGVGVRGLLGFLVACVATVFVVLLAALWRVRRRAGTPRRRPGREPPQPRQRWLRHGELAGAVRSTLLLAVGDVLGMVGVAVLYAVLDLRSTPDQISLFYVLALISSAASVLWSYLLRIGQPRALAWLDAVGATVAVARIRSGLITGIGAGAVATIALVLVALVLVPRSVLAVAAGALVVEMLLFGLVTLAAFLVESLSERGRARSATSALAALAATMLAGWPLISAAGAAGSLLALCVGLLVRAAALAITAGAAGAGLPTVGAAESPARP